MPYRHRLIHDRILAARDIHGVETLLRADAAADAAGRSVRRNWELVGILLKQKQSFAVNYQRARAIFARMRPEALTVIAAHFRAIARWTQRDHAKTMLRVLPVDYLQAAVGVPAETAKTIESAILERAPGIVSLTIGPGGTLQGRDEAAPLKEPIASTLDDATKRQIFGELLFPPPSEDTVNSIIYAGGWRERMQQATRLGDPDTLARILTDGISQGKSQDEIEKLLRPHVQDVYTTSKRLARTYGIQVANEMRLRSDEQMTNLIDGYQVRSMGGHNARPDHAARSGTTYYRNPGAGQKGFDVMPRPPVDNGDPPGKFGIRWNCRCGLTPVLAPPRRIVADPAKMAAFANAANRSVPDPSDYAMWFDRADEKRRRLAVGSRRYSTMRDKLGAEPEWAHFLDADTGDLLTMRRLQDETPEERTERMGKVKTLIADRKKQIEQLSTYGFIPPPPEGPSAAPALPPSSVTPPALGVPAVAPPQLPAMLPVPTFTLPELQFVNELPEREKIVAKARDLIPAMAQRLGLPADVGVEAFLSALGGLYLGGLPMGEAALMLARIVWGRRSGAA